MLAFPCRNNLILLLLVAALAGCGSDDEKKPATQVAAKVNKGEISVHQINNVLARTGNIAPEQAKAASKQILEKLVDQELLVQQAMESKLDRDPKTMQAIEAARREILSRAYLDKVASSLIKPTPDEIRVFYTKHPELFGERRIYQFRQLGIQTAEPGFLSRLQQQMSNVKSLAEVAAWLNAEKIPFAANSGTKAAEELPMELLPKFHQMKDGQIGVIPGRDGVMVVQLTASRSMSMDEKAATPFIEQFLNNQRRVEAAEKEMKQLREKAKIEYMGEFAAAKADDEKIKAADSKPTPAVPAETKADATHMGKGLSGLK